MPPRTPVMLVLFASASLSAACGGDSAALCSAPGTMCVWAGTGDPQYDGDGRTGPSTSLYWPMDVAFAPDGRAYVSDWNNHRVRRVGADGLFETVMGNDLVGDGPRDLSDLTAPGAVGTEVELNHPTDVDFLPDGRVVVAAWHNHKIRVLDPATGRVTVLIGRGPGVVGDANGDGGPAGSALLNQPKSVAVDAAGGVLVTDSRNQRIRRIAPTPDHTIATLAGSGGPAGVTADPGPCLEAKFSMQRQDENPEPGGNIAVDAQGRVYLADAFNDRIRRLDPHTQRIETVAGNGTPGFSGDGGPAVNASLNRPRDVELGPDGRLYIADTNNHRVRAVDLQTGVITTVAGGGVADPVEGGAAIDGRLQRPFGIAFDGQGNLYVADTFANQIWKVVR